MRQQPPHQEPSSAETWTLSLDDVTMLRSSSRWWKRSPGANERLASYINDGVLIGVGFVVSYLLAGRSEAFTAPIAFYWENTHLIVVLAVCWWLLLVFYDVRVGRILAFASPSTRRGLHLSVVYWGVIAVGAAVAPAPNLSVLVALWGPVCIFTLMMGRIIARWILQRIYRLRNVQTRAVAVLPPDLALYEKMTTKLDGDLQLAGVCFLGSEHEAPADVRAQSFALPVAFGLDKLEMLLRETHSVLAVLEAESSISPQALQDISWELRSIRAEMVIMQPTSGISPSRAEMVRWRGFGHLLHIRPPELDRKKLFIKRVLDFLAGIVAIIITGPLFILIALAIKIDDRGPVFYRQERMGLHNDPFIMWKFRSMVVNADKLHAELSQGSHDGAGPLFKLKADNRITRVGRVLRRTSLDELPQFFNVLNGTMSFVGPRPPLRREVEAFRGSTRRRMQIRPGITGLWQVSGRSDLTWEESAQLDLYYVENYSIAQDLSILLRTAKAVITGRGAY